jgi:hypothetical protein
VTLFALSNLWMVRRRLLNMAQACVCLQTAKGLQRGSKAALKRGAKCFPSFEKLHANSCFEGCCADLP